MNGVLDSSVTSATYPAANTSSNDVIYVTCTANDGIDDGNVVTSTNRTIGNSVPSITDCMIDNYSPTTTENLTASVLGWSDADGDPEAIQYAWAVNGVIDSSITTNVYPAANTSKGDKIGVQCTPNDGASTGSPVTSTIATVINTAPSITDCALTSATGNFQTLDDIDAVISGWNDVDGDQSASTFEWFLNGASIGTGPTLGNSAFVKGDDIYVVCTADDGDDTGTVLQSAAVTITNSAPAITDCILSPLFPATTEELIVTTAGWSDADADAEATIYQWYVGGVLDSTVSGPTYPSANTSFGDQIYVSCIASDGSISGNTVTSEIRTIGNSPPSITGCSLNLTDPTTNDDLVATLDGWSDADGDPAGATYEWFVNLVLDPQVTTATFPSNRSQKGDEIYVRCTPNDGMASGVAANSDVATVVNSAPSLNACAIESTSGTLGTDEDLTVSTSGWLDPDGDSEATQVEWFVNGNSVATGLIFDHASFVKGDQVSAECTPYDGAPPAGAVISAASVLIPNTAPAVSNASISAQQSGQAGDTLTCGYTFNDADYDIDQSTVQWAIDGIAYATGATLSNGFSGGQEVTCTVTANDGTDVGNSVVATYTANNTSHGFDSDHHSSSGGLWRHTDLFLHLCRPRHCVWRHRQQPHHMDSQREPSRNGADAD